MIRNYALTFAAVTLRLYLTFAFIVKLPFEVSYSFLKKRDQEAFEHASKVIAALAQKHLGAMMYAHSYLDADNTANDLQRSDDEVSGMDRTLLAPS